MASNSKNQDIVELIIKGQDEYSDVSEEVRQELEELATQAGETRTQFDQLERSLDLAETYRAQEAEVSRLARAQAEAKIEVDQLTKANKEAKGENLEIVESLARARAELGSYRTATNRAQKALDKTKDSMRQYGVSLEQVEQSQTEMKDSSSQLADELTELQKKQAKLVSDAREQIQASRDKALAQQQYNEALRQQSNAMADQFRSYTKQQAEQRKVKAETERLTQELRDLASQLEKGDISWEDFRRRATDAGRAADLTQKQVAGVRRSLEGLVVSSRQSNQALQEQARETKRVEQATEDYRYELERLLEKYRAGKIDIAGFEKAEAQLRRKMKLNEQQVESTRREMGAYQAQLKQVPVAQSVASKSTDKMTRITRRLAQAYTILLAAQKSLDLAMTANRAYTESEDAMLGLQKTTELTAREINGLVAEMSRLSGDVTSTTKAELLAIAEAAGRMGIEGAENISAFTKSIDALSSATGLAGDETAQAIAQILNVTGEAQSNVVGVSSVIAELGNTTATTEEQIVHFAKRLATDTKTAKLTSAEVLGIASSMAEMGLQAEGASTVIGRTFRFIEDAVKGGGKAMEDLQRITGQTEAEIQQAFGEDKVALFSSFVGGISRVQDSGETLNSILSDMGIKSDENARILGLLSQTYGTLNQNVATANKAFIEGNAHFEEMAKKEAALSSSMQRLQNRVKGLAEVMGEAFSDDLMRGMDSMGRKSDELEGRLAEVGETAADVVIQLADIASTVGGLLEPLEMLTDGVGVFDGLLTGLSMNLDMVAWVVNLVTGGIAQLGIAWNKFFGDTEDVESWTRIQEDAFERASKSAARYNDNLARMNGESSRAFQDLRDAYNENRDALARMDEEQRKAVETIINSTGYLEGNDSAYRDLTRAIQRAAEEKRILKGLTDEENSQVNEHIKLLRAQGIEEAEAARIAREAALARQQKAEQEKQQTEDQVDLDKQASDQRQAQLKAEQEAFTALGLSMAEVTGQITEQGQAAITAFETIAESGKYSGEQIEVAMAAAIDKLKTPEDFEAFEKLLVKLGEDGELAGDKIKKGMELAEKAASQLQSTFAGAATDMERSLNALGLSMEWLSSGILNVEQDAIDAFSTVVDQLFETEGRTEEAADKIMVAFDRAFAKIESPEALDAFADNVTKAYNKGMISGKQFQDVMDDIKAKYEEMGESAQISADQQVAALAKVEAAARKAAEAQAQQAKDEKAAAEAKKKAAEAEKRQKEAEEKAEKRKREQEKRESEQRKRERERERAAADRAADAADRLNNQKMDKLEGEMSRAREEAERLRDSLEGTVASLEQELANMRGETMKAEQIEQERKMVRLREQFEQARASGDQKAIQAAQRALSLQQEIYAEKVRQIKEEEAREAAKKADQEAEDKKNKPEHESAEQQKKGATTVQNKVVRLQIATVNGEMAEGDFTEQNADRFLRALSEAGAVVK